jgi:uncharacterized protein YndB with AHSA1/START domain
MSTLKVTLPSDREIVMTREFNAPRQLVWDAHTKPELIRKWMFGPPGWSLAVSTLDLRVGGSFRFEWRNDSDGSTMVVSGVYTEIKPIERIVHTENFDDPQYEGESIETLVLTERNGKTILTNTLLYPSKATRDAILKSGLTSGVEQNYDRLAETLAASSAAKR